MRLLVELELRRILDSASFQRSSNLSRLLQYLVENTLANPDFQLKEYVLGKEVFGRGGEFDPRVDPIVRVQARKLRLKLAEFYKVEGAEEGVRIEIPKGGYAPVFLDARSLDNGSLDGGSEVAAEFETAPEESGDPIMDSVSAPRAMWRMPLWMVVMLTFAAIGAGYLLGARQGEKRSPAELVGLSALTLQPIVDMANTPDSRAEADVLSTEIQTQFGARKDLLLLERPHPRGWTLRGFLQKQEGQKRMVMELILNRTGEAQWTGTLDRDAEQPESGRETLAHLMQQVTGIINGTPN